jgi:predicted CoA-binding protein
MTTEQSVVVVGASARPDRYSNMAVRLLKDHGHKVIPVHPTAETIEDLPVVHTVQDIRETVDTVTMYVGADRSSAMKDELIALHPGRVIFNPGAENPMLASQLAEHGISTENACTLVLLNTGQF